MPVPDRLTVWGLSNALSVTVNCAVSLPTVAGANVTLIVQLAPAATELPQLLVWVKSPEAVRLEMFSPTLPLFVSVTT